MISRRVQVLQVVVLLLSWLRGATNAFSSSIWCETSGLGDRSRVSPSFHPICHAATRDDPSGRLAGVVAFLTSCHIVDISSQIAGARRVDHAANPFLHELLPSIFHTQTHTQTITPWPSGELGPQVSFVLTASLCACRVACGTRGRICNIRGERYGTQWGGRGWLGHCDPYITPLEGVTLANHTL